MPATKTVAARKSQNTAIAMVRYFLAMAKRCDAVGDVHCAASARNWANVWRERV